MIGRGQKPSLLGHEGFVLLHPHQEHHHLIPPVEAMMITLALLSIPQPPIGARHRPLLIGVRHPLLILVVVLLVAVETVEAGDLQIV